MYHENHEREIRTGFGMFKAVAVIAAIILALLLTGCGNKTDSSGTDISRSGRNTENEEEEVLSLKTPEERYRYVAGAAFDKAGASFAAAYDNYMEGASLFDQKIDTEATLEIFDPASDMLESYTGIDFSWLKTLGVSADVNLAEDGVEVGMDMSLNGRDLIGMDVLMDYQQGEIYGRIPRLSDKYFQGEVDLQSDSISTYYRLRQQQELMLAMLPEGETLAKIMSRCKEAALEQIEDVEEGSDTLIAGGVSAEYTTLTVTLTEELAQDIAEAVCDVLKEDKDVEDIIVNLEEISGGESYYDEFLDALEELPEQIRLADEIEITLYVNDSNQIRGRVVEVGDFTVRYAIPEDGDDVGFELAVENDGELLCRLYGDGQRKKNTIEGTYTLETEETELCTISVENFDTAQLEDGELIGKFTIQPTSDFYNVIGADSLTARTLEAFSLALDLERNEVAIEVYMDGEPFVALTERVERSRSERLPPVTGAEDISTWANSLLSDGSLQDYVDYLKGSDIPVELLQQLLGSAF